MTKSSVFVAICVLFFISSIHVHGQEAKPRPLKALLIAGGCCHDYAAQQEALCKGIQSRANVQVDVYWTDNSTTAPYLPLYSKLNWADGYDVIIHDECAASISDDALINRIIQTHQKIPAVHLHCALHSFRNGTDAWFKHLGLQSNSHGPQEPIEIHFADSKHPITQTLSDWTTVREELYNNVTLFDANSLAVGKQTVSDKDKTRVDEAIVVWTNEAQGARSFSTSLGHNTETVQDPRYLELVTRGLLWACDRLTPEYLTPYPGENKVTFIDKNMVKSPSDVSLGSPPEGATLVKVTASSTQAGNENLYAIDGKGDTRWCASGPDYPQWLHFEFEKPVTPSEIEILWESNGTTYKYLIEGSADGKTWTTLIDAKNNTEMHKGAEPVVIGSPVQFLRITGLGSNGGWCSIWEVKLKGEGITKLWPCDTSAEKNVFVPTQGDTFAKSGNMLPKIEPMTKQKEASILEDVQVPDGFEVTLFAAPPAVNYPVFVAASVDGTVFVSSDGNGSLGRSPDRGRVIRLRDLDGDGRADETKVFCQVDAPRGLVWDHDRLYLMHPPHLSAFIDNDGDGIADEQKVLVRNLAFDYDKRPADHTTNGVSLGVDGWLYIAGGDFGFIDAEGTDGRKLTHRGGGVIRVRPDGTGLEVYSTGTRNILEVAISPQMDMFARDNTNDGGGWDVRLHHFTGMDDHGYPRLYKNFPTECIQPLADYGGGSGCGAVYIDEPGFGKWGNAPFTADWGTGSLFRHSVSAKGATFQETRKPDSFIKMTRPTDADVDGNSRVYCASWRGATFDWAGPDVGYIVCVKPKNFQPEEMPKFATESDTRLIDLMHAPSYRRRVEAQRELIRRGNLRHLELLDQGVASRSTQRNLLDQFQTSASDEEIISHLDDLDPIVVHTAIRCLASRNASKACFQALDSERVNAKAILRSLEMMHTPEVVDELVTRLSQTTNSHLRVDILAALCRLHFEEGKWNGDSWGTRPDTRGPYYQPESWSETKNISEVLRKSLERANPEEAAALLELMQSNRIPANDSLANLIELAKTNDRLLGSVIAQLAVSDDVSEPGMAVLYRAANLKEVSITTLVNTIVALSKVDTKDSTKATLAALRSLEIKEASAEDRKKARDAFLGSSKLESRAGFLEELANSNEFSDSIWADSALLAIASRTNGSPEGCEQAKKAVGDAWQQTGRQVRLMQAAMETGSHFLDDQILQVAINTNVEIAKTAKSAIDKLAIKAKVPDNSPKISTISVEEVTKAVIDSHGDFNLGKQVFTRANCSACHTVRQDEPQKGPYLGTIAKTYKRPELVTALLEPNKTIAQGFVTNLIQTNEDLVLTGFVTSELTDRVTIRDQHGKETVIMKDDIQERKTSPISVMPTGIMNDFTTLELASLVDYLESLAP